MRKLELAARATWTDPQQKQHSIMGLLIAFAGAVEVLLVAGLLMGIAWGTILPIALFGVGVMFIAHTQHGTEEAAEKSVIYHRVLGIFFVVTGIPRGLHIALPSTPGYLWAGSLLAAALLLAIHREPEGSYETGEYGPSNRDTQYCRAR